MSNPSTQYEVLFLTGTSFSSRQWHQKEDTGQQDCGTSKDQLEEACWNGLLPEIFPEIFSDAPDTRMIYLWQIKQADSFLEIDLGEVPVNKDNYFSIDPYAFLLQQHYS